MSVTVGGSTVENLRFRRHCGGRVLVVVLTLGRGRVTGIRASAIPDGIHIPLWDAQAIGPSFCTITSDDGRCTTKRKA
jgi:hypothetical protein